MRIFDPCLDTRYLDDLDYENLAYFDLVDAAAFYDPGPTRTAPSYEAKRTAEQARNGEVASEVGIRLRWMAGFLPGSRPQRAHQEVWSTMESRLNAGAALAVGPIVIDEALEARHVESHLELARAADAPAVIQLPQIGKGDATRVLLRALASVGFDPSRCLVVGIDYTNLRPVHEAGCGLGIALGPAHLAADTAVEMLERFEMIGSDRVFAASGVSQGATDVMAIPKIAIHLRERGASAAEIESIVWGTARRLLGIDSRANETDQASK